MELPYWLKKLVELLGYKELEKIVYGERLEPPEIEKLLTQTPLHVLGAIADYYARLVKNNIGSYVVNIYISYTNICSTACSFCAFYNPLGRNGGYVRSPEEIAKTVKWAWRQYRIREVHLVGGNNPDLDFDYYEKLIKAIKNAAPKVVLKGFTAEEIAFMSRVFGERIRSILERFKELGLDALSGGGAEILDEEVHKIIAPKKPGPDEYLRVHEEAHKLGIKSNVTIMYGHIEKPINVARHLYRVARLEEKSPGFISFILVRFNPGNTPLAKTRLYRERVRKDGVYDARITATARLVLLGKINNIVSYWVALGDKLAQALLTFGANDLGGTFYNESVISVVKTGKGLGKTPEELEYMLMLAGWTPAERDTFYNYYGRRGCNLQLPWLNAEQNGVKMLM